MMEIIKNKEEVKSVMNIIQAFADGKTIQAIDPYEDEWVDQVGLNFKALFEGQYRIKPEPKYRPFANTEECWTEMLKHQPFGWIHVTDDNLYHNIIMLAPELGCHEAYIRIGNCTVRGLEETFRIATFADGQPFGVKIEEG